MHLPIGESLFNFYVSFCPQSASIITSFADDFGALESATTPEELEANLTAALGDIAAWADDAKLTVSSSKTTMTLFTSNPHEVNKHEPIVHLGQTRLPVDCVPKVLGVTFDPTIANPIAAIEVRAKKCLQVLKALAGTLWGHSKETLIATFKSILQPLFTYAAPIWYPNTSNSNFNSCSARSFWPSGLRPSHPSHNIIAVPQLS